MQLMLASISALAVTAGATASFSFNVSLDRWMYPFNATPGARIVASTFGAQGEPQFDNRDGQMIIGFETAGLIAPGQGPFAYDVASATIQLTVANDLTFIYDDTLDPYTAFLDELDPEYVADADAGQPIELFGCGYRGGLSVFAFQEDTLFAFGDPLVQQSRNAYALGYNGGAAVDVSMSVDERWTPTPFAIGTISGVTPGDFVPAGSVIELDIDVDNPDVLGYLQAGLNVGRINFVVTSLTAVVQGTGPFPLYYCREHPDVEFGLADAASLDIRLAGPCAADVDGSGTVDFDDLVTLLANWGACTGCPADIDDSGIVDFDDLVTLLANWGPC